MVIKIKTPEGTKEKRVSEKDHLASQIKYKHIVFKDKTKYNRKRKHKNRVDY